MKFEVPVIKMAVKSEAKTAEINIEGEIGWVEWDGEKYNYNTSAAIRNQLAELMDLKVDKIVVNIHSLGGYVDDALAIHDALAMHPAEVETRVTGFTASAATVIAQAGKKRTISANSMYLVHEAWGFTVGTANQMLKDIEMLDTLNDSMANLYAKRAGGKKEKYRGIMAENDGVGKWITAEKAVELGFADESFEPMKAAASVVAFNRAKALGLNLPEIELPQADAPELETEPVIEPIKEIEESDTQVSANQYSDLLLKEVEILTKI